MEILEGRRKVTGISVSDVDEILAYGWDPNDVARMVDEGDADGIAGLAAWIRKAGDVDHGFIVDDEAFYHSSNEEGLVSEGCYRWMIGRSRS